MISDGLILDSELKSCLVIHFSESFLEEISWFKLYRPFFFFLLFILKKITLLPSYVWAFYIIAYVLLHYCPSMIGLLTSLLTLHITYFSIFFVDWHFPYFVGHLLYAVCHFLSGIFFMLSATSMSWKACSIVLLLLGKRIVLISLMKSNNRFDGVWLSSDVMRM